MCTWILISKRAAALKNFSSQLHILTSLLFFFQIGPRWPPLILFSLRLIMGVYFYGIIWDKVGKLVEVVVIREKGDAPLNLTMVVVDTSPDKFNRWLLPDKSMSSV
ncbi:uncharacterized protein LOC114261735 isoform X2 [Camellia sinensis]|uniref:uncharacterized protein LOC114261735 isoform X2 n=1 Tax=Camellia sinensis TaxID=4442 RepID=UPI001035A0BD|nr:uncharacterized protein LOC114261735 isoform X2 [Camellia sinensis]